MTNWKTTVAGVLTIIAALAGAVALFFKSGQIPDLAALLNTIATALAAMGVSIGGGLIAAKDASTK
jgi:hypothetical protein